MQLVPLHTDRLIDLAAGWLGEERNYRWLDFGGEQRIGALALKVMAHKASHAIRVFTSDDGDAPIGVVGLSNMNADFRTGVLWTVLGERRYSAKGYAHRASAAMLTLGFDECGLECINAWAVECNYASLRALRRLHFRPIGRQRRCHYIDGNPFDRLWFDLLASEHREKNSDYGRAIAQ
ncbi:MAG: GNAT family N-acetyltransferase [Bacillota bacterium]